MYIYISRVCTYSYVPLRLCCMYSSVSINIYVWIDVDVYLCPHMLVCIGECMYIYICIYIYIYAYVHGYIHMCVYTSINLYMYMYNYIYICIYIHLNLYVQRYMNIYICIYINMNKSFTCVYIYTYEK